jgi:glyoxylase I family protein
MAPPFTLKGLDHLVLRVADMDRAVAFYRDVIGATEERRVERIGLVQLRAGASLIDLVPLGDMTRGDGNMEHFALTVEPFDEAAIAAHLDAHGVAHGEAVPRYGAEGDGPSLYLDDPDGNQIELKGPPDA